MFLKLIGLVKYNIRKQQASAFHKSHCQIFEEKWFKNKRVAIIGGADSATKKENGSFIDDFDCVVRINKGVQILEAQSNYLGKRTDFLFHAFIDNPNDIGRSPLTPNLWIDNNVGNIVYSFNHKFIKSGIYDLLVFKRNTNSRLKFTELNESLHKKNEDAISPFRPTTGFIAINTVFNCQPKEIYITGITFFKTPHNKQYRDEKLEDINKLFKPQRGFHNPNAEFNYVKKLYINYPQIIKPDSILEAIFNSN
jgi:hypothetical protein